MFTNNKRGRQGGNPRQSKRNRTDSAKNWTVDVLEDGDPLTKIKHHRLGTFFVGVPGKEFTVRVTIHPAAWHMHRAGYFKVMLHLDDKEVRFRYLQKPQWNDNNSDVIWTFDSLRTGHAFKFADRKGSKKDGNFRSNDKTVGQLRVTFQAAEEKFVSYEEAEFMKTQEDKRGEIAWDVAQKVKFDASQKDKFGTLRTVKGRMIRAPKTKKPGQSGPKWMVNDFVYGDVSIFYDSAEHLEYRGILRPSHQKEHRYFFPGRDFSSKVVSKAPSTMLDLTGSGVKQVRVTSKRSGVKAEAQGDDEGEWISVFDN